MSDDIQAANKIFLMSIREEYAVSDYESYDGFVVIAASEDAARKLIDDCGDECRPGRPLFGPGWNTHLDNNPCIWHDPIRSACECIGMADPKTSPRIVMYSFRAG